MKVCVARSPRGGGGRKPGWWHQLPWKCWCATVGAYRSAVQQCLWRDVLCMLPYYSLRWATDDDVACHPHPHPWCGMQKRVLLLLSAELVVFLLEVSKSSTFCLFQTERAQGTRALLLKPVCCMSNQVKHPSAFPTTRASLGGSEFVCLSVV